MNLKIGTSHPSSNKVFFFKLNNMKEKKKMSKKQKYYC